MAGLGVKIIWLLGFVALTTVRCNDVSQSTRLREGLLTTGWLPHLWVPRQQNRNLVRSRIPGLWSRMSGLRSRMSGLRSRLPGYISVVSKDQVKSKVNNRFGNSRQIQSLPLYNTAAMMYRPQILQLRRKEDTAKRMWNQRDQPRMKATIEQQQQHEFFQQKLQRRRGNINYQRILNASKRRGVTGLSLKKIMGSNVYGKRITPSLDVTQMLRPIKRLDIAGVRKRQQMVQQTTGQVTQEKKIVKAAEELLQLQTFRAAELRQKQMLLQQQQHLIHNQEQLLHYIRQLLQQRYQMERQQVLVYKSDILNKTSHDDDEADKQKLGNNLDDDRRKRERISYLFELLGLNPNDLFNMTTALHANKNISDIASKRQETKINEKKESVRNDTSASNKEVVLVSNSASSFGLLSDDFFKWAGLDISDVNKSSFPKYVTQSSFSTEVGLPSSHTEVGLPSSHTEVGLPSSHTEVGLPSSYTEVGLPSSHTEVGLPSSYTEVGLANNHADVVQTIILTKVGQGSSLKDLGQVNSSIDVGQLNFQAGINQQGPATDLGQATKVGQSNFPADVGQAMSPVKVGQLISPINVGEANSLTDIGKAKSTTSTRQSDFPKHLVLSNIDSDRDSSDTVWVPTEDMDSFTAAVLRQLIFNQSDINEVFLRLATDLLANKISQSKLESLSSSPDPALNQQFTTLFVDNTILAPPFSQEITFQGSIQNGTLIENYQNQTRPFPTKNDDGVTPSTIDVARTEIDSFLDHSASGDLKTLQKTYQSEIKNANFQKLKYDSPKDEQTINQTLIHQTTHNVLPSVDHTVNTSQTLQREVQDPFNIKTDTEDTDKMKNRNSPRLHVFHSSSGTNLNDLDMKSHIITLHNMKDAFSTSKSIENKKNSTETRPTLKYSNDTQHTITQIYENTHPTPSNNTINDTTSISKTSDEKSYIKTLRTVSKNSEDDKKLSQFQSNLNKTNNTSVTRELFNVNSRSTSINNTQSNSGKIHFFRSLFKEAINSDAKNYETKNLEAKTTEDNDKSFDENAIFSSPNNTLRDESVYYNSTTAPNIDTTDASSDTTAQLGVESNLGIASIKSLNSSSANYTRRVIISALNNSADSGTPHYLNTSLTTPKDTTNIGTISSTDTTFTTKKDVESIRMLSYLGTTFSTYSDVPNVGFTYSAAMNISEVGNSKSKNLTMAPPTEGFRPMKSSISETQPVLRKLSAGHEDTLEAMHPSSNYDQTITRPDYFKPDGGKTISFQEIGNYTEITDPSKIEPQRKKSSEDEILQLAFSMAKMYGISFQEAMVLMNIPHASTFDANKSITSPGTPNTPAQLINKELQNTADQNIIISSHHNYSMTSQIAQPIAITHPTVKKPHSPTSAFEVFPTVTPQYTSIAINNFNADSSNQNHHKLNEKNQTNPSDRSIHKTIPPNQVVPLIDEHFPTIQSAHLKTVNNQIFVTRDIKNIQTKPDAVVIWKSTIAQTMPNK